MRKLKKSIGKLELHQLDVIKDFLIDKTSIDITKNKCSRKQIIKEVRFMYSFLAKNTNEEMDYATIGAYINKDHASIMHAIKTFENVYLMKYAGLVDLYFKKNTKINTDYAKILNQITDLKKENEFLSSQNASLKRDLEEKEFGKIAELTSNPILREVLKLDDETINFVCETRLKPFLLMNKSKI